MTTTWNSSDKSSNVTLSNGNLTATMTSGTQGAVRANTSVSAGKIYLEFYFAGAVLGNKVGVGWANSTASLASFIGTDKNGFADMPSDGGAIPSLFWWFNNVSSNTGEGTGGTICLAVDFGASKAWVRAGGPPSFWNQSSSADPASGTGGFSFSTINAGPYFPVFCANANTQAVTANFGAQSWSFNPPSGFAGLDSSTVVTANSSKFLGYPIIGPIVASSSKFLGYPIIGPIVASSSKFLGYPIIGPIVASSSKFLCYVVIQPPPQNYFPPTAGRPTGLAWALQYRYARDWFHYKPRNRFMVGPSGGDDMTVTLLF
jgi:hypothetical protein